MDAAENTITPDELSRVKTRKIVKGAKSLLLKNTEISRENFTLVRDYLGFTNSFQNGQRAGAVIGMMIDEFYRAWKDREANKMIINVKRHKTKRAHGPAQIVVDLDV